jgi:hypothetical protein
MAYGPLQAERKCAACVVVVVELVVVLPAIVLVVLLEEELDELLDVVPVPPTLGLVVLGWSADALPPPPHAPSSSAVASEMERRRKGPRCVCIAIKASSVVAKGPGTRSNGRTRPCGVISFR